MASRKKAKKVVKSKAPTRRPAKRPKRVLQGKYIGWLRHLPKKVQSKIRTIRNTKGTAAAIAAMKVIRAQRKKAA